jgi:Leucine-rich repeat (LRR) protein
MSTSRWNTVWAGLAALCLVTSGCNSAGSPQIIALAALEERTTVESRFDESGNVVTLKAASLTDELASQLAGFPQLKSLTLSGSPLGNAGLAQLKKLSALETLLLDDTGVTDEGMPALSALTQLKRLNLAGCEISDEGLAALAPLTELRMLNLSRTQVRGKGFVHLSALSQLESLYLQEAPVNFEGHPPFAGLPSLKILQLAKTDVDGSIVGAISALSSLERLYLDGTKIQDADIPALAAVLAESTPHLKGLFFDRTRLSDASLESFSPLANLPELALMHLHGTRISHDGYVRLRQLLPEVNLISEH